MIKVKETKEILNRISYLFSSGSIPTCYSCCLVFLFSRSCAVFFIFFRRRNFFHAVSFHCNFWRTFSYFFYRWNSISGFFKSIVFPFLVSLQRFFVSAIPPFPIYSIFWLNFIFFLLFTLKFPSPPPCFFHSAEILLSSSIVGIPFPNHFYRCLVENLNFLPNSSQCCLIELISIIEIFHFPETNSFLYYFFASMTNTSFSINQHNNQDNIFLESNGSFKFKN